MVRRQFLVVLMVVVSLLVVGCGIPKEDYDAAVAAKQEAEAQVASLESEVSSLRDQVSSLTNEVATAERTIAELKAAGTEGTVTPTPIAALSKDYSKFGFGFDYPTGFSIIEMGMLDSEANDNSGLVQVAIQTDGIQMFQVAWFHVTLSTWRTMGDWQQMLTNTLEGMKVEGIESVDKGEIVETTKAGHEMGYQCYEMTSMGVTAYGIAAVFHCDDNQRCYQLIIVDSTISAEEDVLEDFMSYLDSFVCH